jgi:hypothetical protein
MIKIKRNKETKMKVSFWIWTFVCLIIAGFLIWRVSYDQKLSGNNITLHTNYKRYLTIDAESVTIEAASSSFFMLRQLSGETIIGTATEKPLGWVSKEYYTAEKKEFPGGEWIVEKGNYITVHITSPGSFTVQEGLITGEKIFVDILIAVAAILVWLIIGIGMFYKKDSQKDL